MTNKTYQQYKKLRNDFKFMTSKCAFDFIKAERDIKPPYDIDFRNSLTDKGDYEFEYDGFDIRIKVKIDEYADLSWLGEFSNDREENSIRHNLYIYGCYERWFNPCGDLEEIKKCYHNLGYSKHDSYVLAKKELYNKYLIVKELYDDGIWRVTVSVYMEDIKLASNSIGEVDYDYINELIRDNDLILETIKEAKEVLNSLCNCDK